MDKKFFIVEESVNPHLSEIIIERISKLERRRQTLRFALYGSILGAACIALIPAVYYTHAQLVQSGFGTYASLILSDGDALRTSWKEFSLVLIESLPIIGMTLIFGILFTLLASVKQLAKNMHYRQNAPQLSF